MKTQTFIFVHDEQIVLDFELNSKFKDVPNLTYVFVGFSSYEKIKHLSNLIIARELKYNIETWGKNLLAYAGWYALYKNNLISADFINLFEYDIILSNNFNEIQQGVIHADIDFIGYIPLEIHDYWFMQCDDFCLPLLNSIHKHYGINCKQYINDIQELKKVGLTSNQSMSFNTLDKFMKWMEPIVEDIKDEYMAGHMPERAFPFYCLYYGLNGFILDKVLSHFSMGTHGTTGTPKEYFNSNYENLVTK